MPEDFQPNKVVLEGCNGSWAQERYLPTLVEKAGKGEIELWAIDIDRQIGLSDSRSADLWQTAQSQDKAYYLDKTQNEQSYNSLSGVSYVFVVAPDQHHSAIAEFSLDHLAPEGKIFIEKPLDASVSSALRLKRKVVKEKKKDAVFAFDHYLARARSFLWDRNRHLEGIGEIERMRFNILEPFGIPSNRVKALEKGMIFDLFCHILALVGGIVGRDLTPSKEVLERVKLEEVKAAQYIRCPISGETFAWIKFLIGDLRVESAIGKCVGAFDDKSMEIYGSKGQIKLDLLADEFSTFDSLGNKKQRGKLNPRHVEGFLERVLQGREPLSEPGVLSFNAAFEILLTLDEAKKRVGNMPEYRVHESVSDILRRF